MEVDEEDAVVSPFSVCWSGLRKKEKSEGAIAAAACFVRVRASMERAPLCFSFPLPRPLLSALCHAPRLLLAQGDLRRRREGGKKRARGRERAREQTKSARHHHHQRSINE